MITSATFYKRMPVWASQRDEHSKESIQYIYFDGKSAFATDTASLVIVKDWPSEAHFETAEGKRVETDKAFPKIKDILVPADEANWIFAWESAHSSIAHLAKEWKQVFTFLRNLRKRHKEVVFPVQLQKKGCRLYAYTANDTTSAKILLLDNERIDGRDWVQAYNANYLLRVLEFIIDTSPNDLRIFGGRRDNTKTMFFETEDLLMALAGINIKDDDWNNRLVDFFKEENIREYDFLD